MCLQNSFIERWKRAQRLLLFLLIYRVIGSSEITISKKEYEKLKRDSENLGMVSFTM